MKARTVCVTLYGIIIALAICVCAIGVALVVDEGTSLFVGDLSEPTPFESLLETRLSLTERTGITAAVVAFITWIWTSVLLAWIDKPHATSGLAISLPHFVSFIIMSLAWLAVGAANLSTTPFFCLGLYCSEEVAIGALSLAVSVFCGAAALFIFFTARKVGGLGTKLIAHDDEAQLYEMKHATRVRTALYCLILVFGLAINIMTPFSIMFTIVAPQEEDLLYLGGADTAFLVIGLICSLFTWIWASVLLAYHRRVSKEAMTKASAHCISTMVLGTVWFGNPLVFLLY
ncbi:hypothetical protein L218DRAFT_1006335 [Marasmius fiardii PR-910]|nr:hypothetical protein L218DRAFT_1006335 [Marasmius fiardii PR-910]